MTSVSVFRKQLINFVHIVFLFHVLKIINLPIEPRISRSSFKSPANPNSVDLVFIHIAVAEDPNPTASNIMLK